MDDFDLDLRTVEEQLDEADAEEAAAITEEAAAVELGVLDGSTPPREWIAAVEDGRVLVLAIEGDLNELAAGFARDIYELDGDLVHFRGFLIVTPPDLAVDSSRLD